MWGGIKIDFLWNDFEKNVFPQKISHSQALTVSDDKKLIAAIMQMPLISVKEIVAFVKVHKNMLNLCPIELLDEKEFSDFELEKLEQDYQIKKDRI